MRGQFKGLWQQPEFMKLWAGQTISEFGSRITREALPYTAALVLAATPFQMGLLMAIGTAPVLIIGLLAGVWVDRLRRRPIMIMSDIGRAVILLFVPLAAIAGILKVEHLYIIAALVGILTVFFEVADQSYLPTLVSREHLVEGNSKLGATSSLAEIGGPPLAGLLVQLITAPISIIFDALSFVFSAFCIGTIRTVEPAPVPPEQRQKVWQEIAEGLRLVLRHPLLRPLAAASATHNFFGGFIGALYILFATTELNISPAFLGFCIAMGGVGAFGGAMLAGPAVKRFGLGTTLIAGLVISSLSLLLLPLASGPLVLIIAFVVISQVLGDAGSVVYLINATSLRQIVVPDHLLGRANASMHFLVGGVGPIGALIGGGLAELIGMRLTLLIGILGTLLAFLWIFFSPLRKLREQPASNS